MATEKKGNLHCQLYQTKRARFKFRLNTANVGNVHSVETKGK